MSEASRAGFFASFVLQTNLFIEHLSLAENVSVLTTCKDKEEMFKVYVKTMLSNFYWYSFQLH